PINYSGQTATATVTASATGYASSQQLVSVSNGTGTQNFSLAPSCTAPSINSQPANLAKTVGDSASFSVTASGSALHYQWKRGTTNVGTDSSSLSIPSVTTADAGSYTVVVSNTCGSVTSTAATLTVAKATPTIP